MSAALALSIGEVKSHFSALAQRVEAGEEIVVSRHGKPVLKLVPYSAEEAAQEAKAVRVRAAMARLRELQAQPDWPKISVAEFLEWRDEGRR